ncbi:MAG TPA: type I glutamate--ammonia ligase [Lachnospiraceae bacterium]|nr:type I glutamate--ammonia ligase [Lachnospiraceae bacterium]
MANTLEDIQRLCKDNQIQIVDFKLTDIDGRWRHLSIPAERLTEDTMIHGIGFDGSNYGYAAVEKSDMVFVPVLDSAVIDTYCEVPTLSMIGDVMIIDHPNNRPFDQYPRNIAKRALEYMKESGIADEMLVGPEYEFYIFDQVAYANEPENSGFSIGARQAEWSSSHVDNNNGYLINNGRGYHISLPMDINNDLRSRMCLAMEKWGIDVKYHHHEVGACGQMEIEVELGEMLKMADNTMNTKYIIKNEAVKSGKTATLMPKPVAGEAGSGMHVHMLLKKEGKPVFYDENGYGGLSDTALYFIGGLLTHARSLCAITNPSTNSYKRLIPGFEAPVTIGYAMANRSAVVRIPAYAKAPEVKRFELRNPDACCNPYFALSAILMAGLDGIKNRIDPHKKGWGPYDFNLFNLPEEEKKKLTGLPASLSEALDALEADNDYLTAGGVFPKRLLELHTARRRRDSDAVMRLPHPKEFALYYDL